MAEQMLRLRLVGLRRSWRHDAGGHQAGQGEASDIDQP
jgi:hypothetical protein